MAVVRHTRTTTKPPRDEQILLAVVRAAMDGHYEKARRMIDDIQGSGTRGRAFEELWARVPPGHPVRVRAEQEYARRNPAKRRNGLHPPAWPTEDDPRYWALPKPLRGTLPDVDPGDSDLSIWTYTEGGKPCAIAFQGKSGKPFWHRRFSSEAARSDHIAESIVSREASLAAKEGRAVARKAYQPSAKPGDIYYTSGGYDQTNVAFFQIVRVSGKSAGVRPVMKQTVRAERGADYVAAVPGKFAGPEKRVVLTQSGFKMGHDHASPWDGRAMYETASGWGH